MNLWISSKFSQLTQYDTMQLTTGRTEWSEWYHTILNDDIIVNYHHDSWIFIKCHNQQKSKTYEGSLDGCEILHHQKDGKKLITRLTGLLGLEGASSPRLNSAANLREVWEVFDTSNSMAWLLVEFSTILGEFYGILGVPPHWKIGVS